ncbi:MAG: beta-lactamase family protein [Rickettsiales bacterium]|jgi:CubicO group peptidase (beta-lactamase class C family)|nr:beta-lactamase family protein [Rickettsiales bacterium]
MINTLRYFHKPFIYFVKLLFIALLSISQNIISAPSLQEIEQIVAKLKDYVKNVRKTWKSPGISVGIVFDGKTYFINEGVGDTETKNKITEDSIFCIMSLSKVVTTTILHQLADEGLISMEDPVTKYLPWFKLSTPENTEAKVKHLVSHCIGLPKFSADTLWHLGFSKEEILKKLATIKTIDKPGKKYAYQNMFVGIAGILIETVLKKPLREIMEERIFKKMEMDSSSVGPHQTGLWEGICQFFKKQKKHDPKFIVSGYLNLGEKPEKIKIKNGAYTFEGTSGINSSTADFLKFLDCLLNKGIINNGTNKGQRLISEDAYNTMSSPQIRIHDIRNSNSHFPVSRMKKNSFYYGNGMFGFSYGKEDKKYIDVLMHEGSGSGWRALWYMVPKDKVGIVVLTNYGSINTSLLPETVIYHFLDMYCGFLDSDWNKKLHDSAMRTKKYFKERFDSYVLGPAPKLELLIGEYESSFYGKASVVQENGKLILKYRKRNIALSHVGGVVYSFDANDLTLRYGNDDYGTLHFKIKPKGKSYFKINLLNEEDEKFKKLL